MKLESFVHYIQSRTKSYACIPVGPKYPVDVPLFILEGVKRLQDGGLRDEILALRGETRLADCGGQVNSARVSPTRRLYGVHEVVLDLVQLKLDLVSASGRIILFNRASHLFR